MRKIQREVFIVALKLVLKDHTEIELAEAGLSQHYVVTCASEAAFQQIWSGMTDENLAEIQITENGNPIQTIIGSKLAGTQTVNNPDGTITGHFYLSGGVYQQQDAEYSEAGKILLGEEA